MIRAILFDLGSTVIANDWKARNEALLKETGVALVKTPELKELYDNSSKGKIDLEVVFNQIVQNTGLSVDLQKVIQSYMKNYEIYSPIDHKMLQLVKDLKKHYKVFAFSNTNNLHQKVNAQRGVFGYFDGSFLSCEMGMIKPDPQIFLTVLEKIGHKPEETLLIDDSEDNIVAASKLGINTIHYESYEKLLSQLKDLNFTDDNNNVISF